MEPSNPAPHMEHNVSASAPVLPTPAHEHFITKYKYYVLGAIALVVIAFGILFFSKDGILSNRAYSQAYSFVNEKISQSASIALTLPEGISKASAQEHITFTPPIKGAWRTIEEDRVLVYEPAEALTLGAHYRVTLASETVNLSSDFLVDEDPAVEAVFPAPDSEAHESAEITIVFNRPMVPLTTLDTLLKKDLPITISPETPGTFKWISTRTLQFTSETHLKRSSHYRVAIGSGLISADGLPVEGITHEFTTRPLRYEHLTSGQTLFNQPVQIVFNQPVDLERTRAKIKVTNSARNSSVPFVVEYGSRTVYDRAEKKETTYTDRSIVNVYQKSDRHGRDKLWDFNSSYRVEVEGAQPLEGNVPLTETRTTAVQVPEIISSLEAQSDRSHYVRPDLFDPRGTLLVHFYEDIDVDKSRITARALTTITYAETCQLDEDGNAVRVGTSGECVMVPDKKTLVLSFDPSALGNNETIAIAFERITTASGLRANAEAIIKNITTYPALQILSTTPQAQAGEGSLTELVVCSNTPIAPRDRETYSDALATDGYLVFNRWQSPTYVTNARYRTCKVGEFESTIRYGLLPESNYTLALSLTDDFGQATSRTLSFRTTSADDEYTRLHNLQKIYNVTTPDKTTFTYAAENLPALNLHICKVSAETLLRVTTDRENANTPTPRSNCSQSYDDTIELPPRYFVNNYFQINLADYTPQTLGHYIITLSSPSHRSPYGNRLPLYERTYVSVTNLAIGEKRVRWDSSYYSRFVEDAPAEANTVPLDSGTNLYWVSRANSLDAVAHASVAVYTGDSEQGITRTATYSTNSQGVAESAVHKDVAGAVVVAGTDSAIISNWTDTLQSAGIAENASKTYLYTDRPIYRPGHEVFIKGIRRVGFDGSYETVRTPGATLTITNARGEEIYQQTLSVNEYGTFSTSFTLPAETPLGTYLINAYGHTSTFDVEEYTPAAFRLSVESEKEEYIAGDTMELAINAEYFFGVPLQGGEVTYTVTSQDYHFDRYTDEYFDFGSGWYFCYSCGYGDEFLFRGKATLDENGTAHVSRKIDFDELYKDADETGSKIFVVYASVSDASGRAVSTQQSFIVHRGEFYLGAKSDTRFMPANTDFTLRAKSVDTSGASEGVGGITLSIRKVTWEVFKRQEVDGGFYYRSEKRAQEVIRDTIRTNKDGDWSDTFSLSEPGQYEAVFTAHDGRDNTLSATTNLYVYGAGQVSVRPTNNYSLNIESERLNLAVGDSAEILLESPYPRAKALISIERGKVFDYWIVDVNRTLFDYSIPMKREYGPNAYVSVLLLSPDPEIKFGQVMFTIDSPEHDLSVSVTPNKREYLPGEEVTLSVITADSAGTGVPADVSIAVADLSVLALKGNPKKNPLAYFFDGFPLSVTTASNIKNILHEVDIPLGTKGGGGGDPDDLAKRERGTFRDTAFWEAHVRTDNRGSGSVTFTLPDNLTTWQIESIGITRDTKLGIDYDEITSRKELMVVPQKPRFIVPGDTFEIGAQVFNQTKNNRSFTVSLESETLTSSGDMRKSVRIDAGASSIVYFPVHAPVSQIDGEHTFTLEATAGNQQDRVRSTISITEPNTFEAFATAHATRADSATEYLYIPENAVAGKGGLTINANATMAVFLSGALDYLVEYPYGCSEQLASKLDAIATIMRGLEIENIGDAFSLSEITFEGETYTMEEVVARGTSRLYENQLLSGAFSYYPGLGPNFHLTLHVVRTLENLREAGFAINTQALAHASSYLYKEIMTTAEFNNNKDLVILTASILRDVDSFSPTSKSALANRIASIAQDTAFLNEQASSQSLAHLAIITSDGYAGTLRRRVFNALENRIAIDGRGAHLQPNPENQIRAFYETQIQNTALLLKAFVADTQEHETLDGILRWLLASRSSDGAWGSTNNTLAVIDAMVDYLSWQEETKADFTLTGVLDGKEQFTFDFNKDTVLQSASHFIPLDHFDREKMHTLSIVREKRSDTDTNFYYDMLLRYALPTEAIAPRDEGITVRRSLYALTDTKYTTPLTETAVGEVVRGRITITIPDAYHFLAIEDYIPAGFEIVNFNLATENRAVLEPERGAVGTRNGALSSLAALFGGSEYLDEVERTPNMLVPDMRESHDDRVFLFVESIAPGVYEYEYFLRALTPGEFQHLPAVAEQMYFPETFGRTAGSTFTIHQ